MDKDSAERVKHVGTSFKPEVGGNVADKHEYIIYMYGCESVKKELKT